MSDIWLNRKCRPSKEDAVYFFVGTVETLNRFSKPFFRVNFRGSITTFFSIRTQKKYWLNTRIIYIGVSHRFPSVDFNLVHDSTTWVHVHVYFFSFFEMHFQFEQLFRFIYWVHASDLYRKKPPFRQKTKKMNSQKSIRKEKHKRIPQPIANASVIFISLKINTNVHRILTQIFWWGQL